MTNKSMHVEGSQELTEKPDNISFHNDHTEMTNKSIDVEGSQESTGKPEKTSSQSDHEECTCEGGKAHQQHDNIEGGQCIQEKLFQACEFKEEDEQVNIMRREFLVMLARRRSGRVPLEIRPKEPPTEPFYQLEYAPKTCEIMSSCPRSSPIGETLPLGMEFEEENLILTTEAGDQGNLPILIIKCKPVVEKDVEKERSHKKAAVVFIHSSYKNKEWLRPLLEAYATRGYVAVAIDSRYHGERANSRCSYRNALVSAWKTGQEMPFIYDTTWDLIKLMDYLSTRKDIDPSRIGITGESLGGMHAWFAAAIDPRYSVAVPIIGVQNFGWAVKHEKWHARVSSIPHVFEACKEDMGKTHIDSEVVEQVWERIAPGLSNRFDLPYTLPALVPRPVLILNGKEDPRCPVEGLEECIQKVHNIYIKAGVPEHFQFIAEEGVGHLLSRSMVNHASVWLDKFLQPDL